VRDIFKQAARALTTILILATGTVCVVYFLLKGSVLAALIVVAFASILFVVVPLNALKAVVRYVRDPINAAETSGRD
jgi:hypothetical protein